MLQRLVIAVAAVFILLIHTSLACVPESLPPLVDDHRNRDYTQERDYIIIPAYQFTCHGRVTGWSACVEPGGDRERYLIHFQVWRSFNGSCYTLIGANIPPELLAPSGHCVNYKVPPGDEIVVMPKDVMGFYTDRYRVRSRRRSRRSSGRSLKNPSTGGVQLDTSQPQISILSTHQQEPSLRVGSRLCHQKGGSLNLASSGRPVLAADVDAIQPLTSSISMSITQSTVMIQEKEDTRFTNIIQPSRIVQYSAVMTQGMEDVPLTDFIQPLIVTTSVIKHSTEATTQSNSGQTTSQPTPQISAHLLQSLHPSSSNQISSSLSTQETTLPETTTHVPLPSTTSALTTYVLSTPVGTTASISSILTKATSTNPLQPQTVHPPVNSSPIKIQSSVVISSPTETGTSAEQLPLLLIAGLAIAGLFLTAIVVLVVILIAVCLYDPNKEDKTQKEESDMEYCEAYELNSNAIANNTQHYQLKEGMVWNKAYHKCVVKDSPETRVKEEHSKQLPSHFTLPTVDGERNGHPLTDTSVNDYEDVF